MINLGGPEATLLAKSGRKIARASQVIDSDSGFLFSSLSHWKTA